MMRIDSKKTLESVAVNIDEKDVHGLLIERAKQELARSHIHTGRQLMPLNVERDGYGGYKVTLVLLDRVEKSGAPKD